MVTGEAAWQGAGQVGSVLPGFPTWCSLCLAESLLPHRQSGAKEGRSKDETRCRVMAAA